MPGYKTHLLGGALIFAPLYYVTTKFCVQQSLPSPLLLLSITLLGSLFPDLDITSKIQRLFYFCVFGAFLYFLFMHEWIQLLITSGLAIIIGVLRHRTILHHPLFLALLPLPVIYYMSNKGTSLISLIQPALFFIAGAWSHLLLDFGLRLKSKKH